MLDASPRILDLLTEAGLTTPDDVLAAGLDGLVAINGIGAKTAAGLLEKAAAALAVPAEAEEVDEVVQDVRPEERLVVGPVDRQDRPMPEEEPGRKHARPAGDGGAPTSEPTPEQRRQGVHIKLVGRSTAVVGPLAVYMGEVHHVSWQHYQAAIADYPAGTFAVRLPGRREFVTQ